METPMQLVAEPRRQAILQLIWDQERSAGEISEAFDVSFSAISQHLARLRNAGFVEVRREGRQRFYRARKEALGPLGEYFERLWGRQLRRLKTLAEAEERNADDERSG
jgi:DNA-binding transcriptional ArsR family regulator